MVKEIKCIVVLISGGDVLGMNVVICGVVCVVLSEGLEIYGVCDGYYGLYYDKLIKLECYFVLDVINCGGIFLGFVCFFEFKDLVVCVKCVEVFKKYEIDGLVVIGGDGFYMGVKLLIEEYGINCIGLLGIIDNDVVGMDYIIGY